jgi:hypothetical protein
VKTFVHLGFLVPALAFLACGNEPAPMTPPPPEPPPPVTAEVPVAPPPPTAVTPPAPPEPPKLPPMEVKPADVPAAPDKMPKVTFQAPKANESIKPDKALDYEIKLEVKDWDVAQGQKHVHLILDNKPYKPIYEPKATVKISDLLGSDKQIAEGQHVLVAFPSRENHVTVKPEGKKNPMAVVSFWVGKAGKAAWKTSDPTLIFSRPKGTYNGAATDSILLDFYLANVELGDGKDSIRATVQPPVGDGQNFLITSWAPWSIKNLPNGETKVKLELLDKNKQPVPGSWNVTERTITVNRDAQ